MKPSCFQVTESQYLCKEIKNVKENKEKMKKINNVRGCLKNTLKPMK